MSSRVVYTCDACGKDFSCNEEIYTNVDIDIPTKCFTVDLCQDCVNRLESVVRDFLTAPKQKK